MSTQPRDIRRSSRGSSAAGSPVPASHPRQASIARLSSPLSRTPNLRPTSPPVPNIPTPEQAAADRRYDLPKPRGSISLSGQHQSALAAALARDSADGDAQPGPSQRLREPSSLAGLVTHDKSSRSHRGSFDERSLPGSLRPIEDPEIVKRHLVQPDQSPSYAGTPQRPRLQEVGPGLDTNEFSSLRLQGGDMTREVYKWAEENEGGGRGRGSRSKSFTVHRPEPESEVLDFQNIRRPGGFRRDYLRRVAGSPAGTARGSDSGPVEDTGNVGKPKAQPQLFTSSFLEFLTLYGHFAGEELEEDDEVLEPDEYFSSDAWDEDQDSDREPGEDSALLTPGTRELRRRRRKERATGTGSSFATALLLLKSFVGTGVLFLPRAFFNGGMLFSCLLLVGVACLSFLCFLLLIKTREKVNASFGDIGGALYGKYMRAVILFSIVLSQVGFVSAYTVFTAENLQAFVLAVSDCKTFIDIKYLILMQLAIFLPYSLFRDISKLGFTAFIADAFIMLGLIYLYYYDIFTIVRQRGVADITLFNSSTWTLFIGTAIFTFEGVGMIIPIQESMKRPEKFPEVLGVVTLIITILFTSVGVLSYAAYGSRTETVVLLNLPQDDWFVNAVQLLYSIAILLSTPLQLFPATRIMENALFTKSGKYNPYIKWQKNLFRFFLVCVCSLISFGGANDLDKFVALVGSFACVPLVYIYPPLLHLKAVATTKWQRALDYAVFSFGLLCCAYTTALTIRQWTGSPTVKTPDSYCRI